MEGAPTERHPPGRCGIPKWVHLQAGVTSSGQEHSKLGVLSRGCTPRPDGTPRRLPPSSPPYRPHPPEGGGTPRTASPPQCRVHPKGSVPPRRLHPESAQCHSQAGAKHRGHRHPTAGAPRGGTPPPHPHPRKLPPAPGCALPRPRAPCTARPAAPRCARPIRAVPCRADPSCVVQYRAGPAHCGPPPGGEDGREAAEARREGEDRPLRAGGYAGGRHLRQSQGLSTEG